LDKELVEAVIAKFGHPTTARDAVEDALRVFLLVPPRMHVFALSQRIDYDPAYNYKAARAGRSKDR
jgi:hypothetical protein